MLLYGQASFALGQLNEMNVQLLNQSRFIKAYVLKEALLSSAIEGVHTTLIDVFTYSLDEAQPNRNAQLVINYTKALEVALYMLQNEKMPITTRVILQAHEALLSSGEGDKAAPGSYRKQVVKVGNLVPAPPQEIPQLMSDLERYINDSSDVPPLIRAGLSHVQFETIHPFLDGNGRIGRLLIVLMLVESQILNLPILYPSYYFKKHTLEYYRALDRVRTHGDFEGWIVYYLQAIKESAIDAYTRAKEIEVLESRVKQILQNDAQFARIRDTAYTALEFLFTHPITTVAEMSKQIGKTYNTTDNILKEFVTLGIVSEHIIHKRNKQYLFQSYLTILEKEYSHQ